MTLPLVKLSGTPYEQGVTHGHQLKDRIHENLDIYFARFEREVGLSRDEVLRRAHMYLGAIQDQNADYYAGLRGIAAGSEFDLDAIGALNVRYEILYYQFGVGAAGSPADAVDGCTGFAVLPDATENGHLLMGQNWDWIPQVKGAILHTTHEDGFETLAFTEAGIFGGKIGLNSAGLGLAINGMTTMDDDWSRLSKPFHVRCYEILRSRDFASAIDVVMGENRACTTNFLIAQTPNHVVDIEAAPDKARLIDCEGGCLVHTNNFIDPDGVGIVEAPSERRIYSEMRRTRMTELLSASKSVTIAQIQEDLKDHENNPFGICRHENWEETPENHYTTVTAVVMDLNERTIHLTDGQPCVNSFQTVALG